MPSQERVRQLESPPVLHGSANRRQPLRVLFVHTVAAEVNECLRELRKTHSKVSADVVSTPEIFAKHLDSKYYDMVLAKYSTTNWSSRVLEVLRERDRRIPVIFLTDKVKPETVAELLTGGAADCVDRDHVGQTDWCLANFPKKPTPL